MSNWKKENDTSWRHSESHAVINLVPSKYNSKLGKYVLYDVYIESFNEPKFNRSRVKDLNYSVGIKTINNWIIKHPRG